LILVHLDHQTYPQIHHLLQDEHLLILDQPNGN